MSLSWLRYLIALLALAPAAAQAQDFTVTAFGASAWVLNGTQNPALSFTRGQTYKFVLSQGPGHPFSIKTQPVTGQGSRYNSGVSGAPNGSTSGTLTFTVPLDAPNTLYYQCEVHSPMMGMLTISNPPAQAVPIPWEVLAVGALALGAMGVWVERRRGKGTGTR